MFQPHWIQIMAEADLRLHSLLSTLRAIRKQLRCSDGCLLLPTFPLCWTRFSNKVYHERPSTAIFPIYSLLCTSPCPPNLWFSSTPSFCLMMSFLTLSIFDTQWWYSCEVKWSYALAELLSAGATGMELHVKPAFLKRRGSNSSLSSLGSQETGPTLRVCEKCRKLLEKHRSRQEQKYSKPDLLSLYEVSVFPHERTYQYSIHHTTQLSQRSCLAASMIEYNTV